MRNRSEKYDGNNNNIEVLVHSIITVLFEPSYNHCSRLIEALINTHARELNEDVWAVDYRGSTIHLQEKRKSGSKKVRLLDKYLDEYNTIMSIRGEISKDVNYIRTHVVHLFHIYGTKAVLEILPRDTLEEVRRITGVQYFRDYCPTHVNPIKVTIEEAYKNIKDKIDYYASTKFFF